MEKEIIKKIKNSHFLRGYEVYRGSSRIEEKEIKLKLLKSLGLLKKPKEDS